MPYSPLFNVDYKVTFDESTNTLSVESPLRTTKELKYTFLVDIKLIGKGNQFMQLLGPQVFIEILIIIIAAFYISFNGGFNVICINNFGCLQIWLMFDS